MADSLTPQLAAAVVRADVYQLFDYLNLTVHFYSNNQAEPLTEEEKYLIRQWFGRTVPNIAIVFEDGEYPLDISEHDFKRVETE